MADARLCGRAGEAVILVLIRSVTGAITPEMDHILMNTWLASQAATSLLWVTINNKIHSFDVHSSHNFQKLKVKVGWTLDTNLYLVLG